MTNHQCRSARERRRIRARVAETRRVPLSEVPYPRSNIDFYRYLYEAGVISQHQYEHLVFRHHYPLTQQSRNYRRYYRRNIRLEHPMDNFTMHITRINPTTIHIDITRANPITYEGIIEHYGERLSESNNSLCQECLMPVTLGIELCEECEQEKKIIPEWMFD